MGGWEVCSYYQVKDYLRLYRYPPFKCSVPCVEFESHLSGNTRVGRAQAHLTRRRLSMYRIQQAAETLVISDVPA